MKTKSIALAVMSALLAAGLSAPASAHKVRKVTARSICHYEERYFVWSPGETSKDCSRRGPSRFLASALVRVDPRSTKPTAPAINPQNIRVEMSLVTSD